VGSGAGDVGCLNEAAVNQGGWQWGVAELAEVPLAPTQCEDGESGEGAAFGLGEVGGQLGALPWHDQVAVTGQLVTAGVGVGVDLVQFLLQEVRAVRVEVDDRLGQRGGDVGRGGQPIVTSGGSQPVDRQVPYRGGASLGRL